MRFQRRPITYLSAVAVLVSGCSPTQSQGDLRGNFASRAAATQGAGAIVPLRSLPRQLLYVADIGSKHFPGVSIYSQRGVAQRKIRSITQDVDEPTGLAVDTNENLYVGNPPTSTVTVYPHGSGSPSETLTEAGTPFGIAVAADGTVYVADHSKTPSILVYPKGQTTPSQMLSVPKGTTPFEVAVDSSGDLFATVNGSSAGSVYEFKAGSSKGENLGLRGLVGDTTGIAIDKKDELLVVDLGKRAPHVLVYPRGKKHASRTIKVNDFNGVIGLAINPKDTEIWVTVGGEIQGIGYQSGFVNDVLYQGGLTLGIAVSPASNE